MKILHLQYLWLKLEPWIAGAYLLYFLYVDVPPTIAAQINILSYGVLAILVIGSWKQILIAVTKEIPLMLLHAMALLSVLWSANPEVTSIESKTLVRALLFGIYLAMRFGIRGEMHLLARMLGLGVVLSFIAGAAVPSYGRHLSGDPGMIGAWKGIFAFKNLFAAHMAVATLLFLLLVISSQRHRIIAGIMTVLSFALVLLSKGKTALAVLVISLCLIPLREISKHRFRSRILLLTTSLLVSLSLLLITLANLKFIVVDLLGKTLEFNGRLPIWHLMLEKGLEQPWFGYGYAGFWTSDASDYILKHTWAITDLQAGVRFNAHNGYLDLFLQLGFVGLLLFLVSCFVTLSRAFYLLFRTNTIESLWLLQTAIFVLLINCSDSIGIVSFNCQWSLLVSFSVITRVECDRIKKEQRLLRYRPEVGHFADSLD